MVSIFNIPISVHLSNISFLRPKNTKQSHQMQDAIDGYLTNPLLDKLIHEERIETTAKTNIKIRELMKKYDLPIAINIDELEKLKQGHLKETRNFVSKIYMSLPFEIKNKINLQDVQQAASFHDYGKVLIPKPILNKKTKLNEKEFEIMKLHSEFGYELLKDKGLSDKVLNLIKYHHQNLNKEGYPKIENNFEYGFESQILNIADKYSALREKRSYKNPLGKYEALEIIAKEVNKGLLSQEIFTALIKSV